MGKVDVQKRVEGFLHNIDVDESGFVTEDEVKQALKHHPELVTHLAAIDIHVDHAILGGVFAVLRREDCFDDRYAIDDVSEGILHLQGYATASKLFELKHEQVQYMRRLETKLDYIIAKLSGETVTEPPP